MRISRPIILKLLSFSQAFHEYSTSFQIFQLEVQNLHFWRYGYPFLSDKQARSRLIYLTPHSPLNSYRKSFVCSANCRYWILIFVMCSLSLYVLILVPFVLRLINRARPWLHQNSTRIFYISMHKKSSKIQSAGVRNTTGISRHTRQRPSLLAHWPAHAAVNDVVVVLVGARRAVPRRNHLHIVNVIKVLPDPHMQ